MSQKTAHNKLLTPEIVAYLTQIHEYKGQQNLFIEAKADALSELLEVAKIQSTEASNRIEGIITTDDRLETLQKPAKSAVSAATAAGGIAASGTDTVSSSDASEVETTPDPVNGAINSASRKNKGASIAVRGSSFWVK